jgi:hypothetical protein
MKGQSMKKTIIKNIRKNLEHPNNAGFKKDLAGINLNKVDLEVLLTLNTTLHHNAK